MINSDIPDPPPVTPRSLTHIALIGVVALLLTVAPIAGVPAWKPVEEGNVKVVKKRGATIGTVLEPGAYSINPVSQLTSSLSVRPQSYTMSSSMSESGRCGDDVITVLSEDGLWTDIDMTVRHRIDAGQAVEFCRSYRTSATTEKHLIRPSARSMFRTEAGWLPVTIIYTDESQTQLEAAAEREFAEEFVDDGLILEVAQVRSVKLPAKCTQAVEQKEITEQRRQQRQDELAVEGLEAEYKRIKAQGQADTNRILAELLSDEVLAQKYIGKLDEADTVYIPIGDGGHPQFVQSLDNDGLPLSGSSVGPSLDTTSTPSRPSTSSGFENKTSN